MQPVPGHFVKLVQLVGRAFYALECPPRDQNPEAAQGSRKGTNVRAEAVSMPCILHFLLAASAHPTKSQELYKIPSILQAEFIGLGVITLDALTRREWVKEDELATEIKAHPKVLRRVLRYFEQVRQSFLNASARAASVTRLALHQ